MGKHLTELLVDDGNHVFVTTRSERSTTNSNLTFLHGNAKEGSFLSEILQLRPWDAIVDFMVYNTEEFRSRFEILLSAADHYLYLSSSRVYTDSQSPIEENFQRLLDQSKDAKFLSTDEYSLTKARQENLLLKSEKKNWTIIRPYITYSEDRLQLGSLEKENWLYRALNGRTILFSEDLCPKLTTLTYGRDVAKGIQSIIGKMEAYGKAIHITQPKSIAWEEVLQQYTQVLTDYLGRAPKVKLVDLKTFLTLQHSPYQVLYDRMFDRSFSTKGIDRYIDTCLFRSPLDGIEGCLKQFLKHPKFLPISWFAQARADKICRERTPLKEIPTKKDRLLYFCVRYFPTTITHYLWSFITHLKRIFKS